MLYKTFSQMIPYYYSSFTLRIYSYSLDMLNFLKFSQPLTRMNMATHTFLLSGPSTQNAFFCLFCWENSTPSSIFTSGDTPFPKLLLSLLSRVNVFLLCAVSALFSNHWSYCIILIGANFADSYPGSSWDRDYT